MKKKKGQITIFLILGILLVGGVGFFLFGNSKKQLDNTNQAENRLSEGSSSNPVENYVRQCMEKTAKDALISAGLDGGVENASEYLLFFGGKTPYYYGTQNSSTPTLDDVQDFLSDYMNSNLKLCVNFSLFPDQNITSGDVNAQASISDKTVRFNVEYPIKIASGKSAKEISDFSTAINSRLKAMHNASIEYVNAQKANPRYMCMTCLVKLGSENNLKINTVALGNTVVYNFYDNTTMLDGKEYNYYFAIKYPETSE